MDIETKLMETLKYKKLSILEENVKEGYKRKNKLLDEI